MASRCTVTGRWTATAMAPTRAPATVPTLHPAWNRGMIDLPVRRSTAAPCTFMATSHAPFENPKTNRPTTNIGSPTRYPPATVASPTASSTEVTVTAKRELVRAMTVPVIGIERSDPAAMASRTSPRLEGLRWKCWRT